MRRFLIVLLLILAVGTIYAFRRAQPASPKIIASALSNPTAPSVTKTKVDFDRQIKPILQKCAPCHFPGGKVYEKLPFDRPETVTKLGTRLFTRIKDENEQRLIREFLGQP